MSLIKPEDVQSWRDICEKGMGVDFNNGNEITDYPLTKHTKPSSYETLVQVKVKSEPPWMKKPNNILSISKCSSYGELVAVIYSALMGYTEEEFDKRNLGLFFNQIKPLINNYVSTHRGNGACQPLIQFRTIIMERINQPFVPNRFNIDLYGAANGISPVKLDTLLGISRETNIKDIIHDENDPQRHVLAATRRGVGGYFAMKDHSLRRWFGDCLLSDESSEDWMKKVCTKQEDSSTLWNIIDPHLEWTAQTKKGKALNENSSLKSCWGDINISDDKAALVLYFSYVKGKMK